MNQNITTTKNTPLFRYTLMTFFGSVASLHILFIARLPLFIYEQTRQNKMLMFTLI